MSVPADMEPEGRNRRGKRPGGLQVSPAGCAVGAAGRREHHGSSELERRFNNQGSGGRYRDRLGSVRGRLPEKEQSLQRDCLFDRPRCSRGKSAQTAPGRPGMGPVAATCIPYHEGAVVRERLPGRRQASAGGGLADSAGAGEDEPGSVARGQGTMQQDSFSSERMGSNSRGDPFHPDSLGASLAARPQPADKPRTGGSFRITWSLEAGRYVLHTPALSGTELHDLAQRPYRYRGLLVQRPDHPALSIGKRKPDVLRSRVRPGSGVQAQNSRRPRS